MLGETRSALILTLTLFLILFSLPEFRIVNAEDPISIRADGSVEGTALIERKGSIYVLTGNITGGIQVEKNYTVIDGAGYSIHGKSVGIGINIKAYNITVRNLGIVNFEAGIETLLYRGNSTIIGNYIAYCDMAIRMIGVSNNILIKKNIIENNIVFIHMAYCSGTHIITENNMINDAIASNNKIDGHVPTTLEVSRNFWSDYQGTDDNKDGIGDTPYISINGNFVDNFPLMSPLDLEYFSGNPPLVSILSPKNLTYTTNSVELNISVNETVSWIRYSIDGKENITTLQQSQIIDLADGQHNLVVYARGVDGYVDVSETAYFTVEQNPILVPTLVIAFVAIVATAGVVLVYFTKKTKNKVEK
ncbi:MAG: hypothetical protein WC325_09020 [Candidatus Bathyarchaeia archaeon]|jgi:hypothetical protein